MHSEPAMRAYAESRAVGSRRRTPFYAEARPRAPLVALAAAAICLACVSLPHGPPGLAAVRFLGVAVPIAVGLYRLAREPADAFARALVAAGAMWSLTTLAASHNSTAYSIGRVSVWLVEPALVFLILAFPHGRVEAVAHRRLLAAVVALAVTLYVPTALLAPFPEPTPWTNCGTHCPANAFQATHATDAIVHDVVRPAREALATILFAAVAIALLRRRRREGAVLRRTLMPVVWVALGRTVGLGGYYIARTADPTSWITDVLGWLFVLSLPLITLSFVAGMLMDRLFVAEALERLTRRLSSRPSAPELRDILADALRDPALEMRFFVPESESQWVEENGWPAPPPHAGPSRATTQVTADGEVLAAIIHDRELTRDRALLVGISSYAITALENRDLVARLRASLHDLGESRARLAKAADDERRRIERNLHDGAQQRLVALQIKLALLAEQLESRSPEDADQLHVLEREIDVTLDEVRRLGHGLFPALLTDRGLSDALHAVARTAGIPTTIDARLSRRYSREAESAVYFACVEALQNVTKHARGATSVSISVTGNGRLQFDVQDNGAGFDRTTTRDGAGLSNMRDRVEALGGELVVTSRRGRGTRVVGTVPI